MQKDETNDLLHQELGFITWDIIDKDIQLFKCEFEKLKETRFKEDKKIEIDFFIRALVHDIENDKDIITNEVYQRIAAIKDKIRGV